MRGTARRALQSDPGARLAWVTVMKTSRLANDITVDPEGQNLHVKMLVELKHWARPLEIPLDRLTYRVLQAPDPGAATVDFAATNNVDQIVIGSRGISTIRRYLGSVSSQVVDRAPCTVTVVKAPGPVGVSEEPRAVASSDMTE
jgi:nucleotide-binding universal stress UspA family protein